MCLPVDGIFHCMTTKCIIMCEYDFDLNYYCEPNFLKNFQ